MAAWRINFPVLRDPWSREECMILRKDDVGDVRAGVRPTQCRVMGMTKAGRMLRFTVPIVDYERACRAPVHLVEVDGLLAPQGTLVDPTGKPLTQLT